MTEGQVRVPLLGWNVGQRRRLRSPAAGAQLDIRWDGDSAVVVAAHDEDRVRELVDAIGTTAAAPTTTTTTTVMEAPALPTAMWAVDPTAVMGRRYGAFFIDVMITCVAFALIFFPLATKRTVPETLRHPRGCDGRHARQAGHGAARREGRRLRPGRADHHPQSVITRVSSALRHSSTARVYETSRPSSAVMPSFAIM